MTDFDDDISLEALLEQHRDATQDSLHTALPARVESYDSAAQTVDATPVVKRAIQRADGTTSHVQLPTIRAIPVCFQRAGDWFVHMPIAAGDTVLLVFCERDFARWIGTAEISDPIDLRPHHLAHAVAIPGVYPRTKPLSAHPESAIVIGQQLRDANGAPIAGGTKIRLDATGVNVGADLATEFMALGNRLVAWLDAHTHPTPSGPSSVPTLLASLAVPPLLSSKHKVQP